MRFMSRVAFDSIHSVAKLLFDAGEFRADYHDRHACDIMARKVQYDEIWTFIYCKNMNVKRAMAASREAVDAWTLSALDAGNKAIPSYAFGGHSVLTGIEL